MSTARNYQNTLRLFCGYASDARYGWVARCLEQFGSAPRQILDEWNTVAHVTEFEGQPHRRPLTYDEVQALFDAADGQVEEIRSRGRKGALAAQRDAALLKTIYAFGLRRREAWGLDLPDLRHNPQARQFGQYGAVFVRWGKSSNGSPPKRRTVLTVPEMDWVVPVLQQWTEEIRPLFSPGRPSGVVGDRARGGCRRGDQRPVRGLPGRARPAPALVVHCLRHSYVTHLIEDGVDPLFVQLLLSPQMGVHDVQHEPLTGADLRGGGGYLPPSITRIPRRFDACSTGPDARLVA